MVSVGSLAFQGVGRLVGPGWNRLRQDRASSPGVSSGVWDPSPLQRCSGLCPLRLRRAAGPASWLVPARPLWPHQHPSLGNSASAAPPLPGMCGDHGRLIRGSPHLGCGVPAWRELWPGGSPVSPFSC